MASRLDCCSAFYSGSPLEIIWVVALVQNSENVTPVLPEATVDSNELPGVIQGVTTNV